MKQSIFQAFEHDANRLAQACRLRWWSAVVLGVTLALSASPQHVARAQESAVTKRPVAARPTLERAVVSDASLVTNAGEEETRVVNDLLARLQSALRARDANALGFFGIDLPLSRNASIPRFKMTHLAVSPGGALVRLALAPLSANKSTSAKSGDANGKEGVTELWLARRGDNDFTLTDRHWMAPSNAAAALSDAASNAWNGLPSTSVSGGALIDLVAERRGGRWIPLRASNIWTGRLLDAGSLAETANRMLQAGEALPAKTLTPASRAAAGKTLSATEAASRANTSLETAVDTSARVTPADTGDAAPDGSPSVEPRRSWDVSPWIRAQMRRYESQMAGTAHFILQNGPRGWVGLDSVWEDNRTLPEAAEKAARQARSALAGDAYFSAQAHRDCALALFATGVYGEAADELAKAAALQPDLVEKSQSDSFEARRDSDPQVLAVRQVESEIKIGLAERHPSKIVPLLLNEFKARPSTLNALRLSLEYSRLAADDVSSDWLETAHDLGTRGNLSDSDRMWINLLDEQLKQRRRVAATKPINIIRSTLFTVRTQPNDLSAVRLLAGLEAAQHTIYTDFGIPMSNTEVVLWSNQRDFQRHTGQLAGTETSEFVTALTLTQLVRTDGGPEVLSEEINFYTDPRADSLSTIAHEYGHVAVRHLCRGRDVPDWINEGVATVVEGGYEDYLPRVRAAAKRGRLLSMRELQAWQIDSPDGERAFLAYSQANSMIDYIRARWGRTALLDLLRQIGRDREPNDAVKIVLGETPDQLWADWRREGIR